MSQRLTITEDEKNHIKGLYLINEGTSKCPNEKLVLRRLKNKLVEKI
jgi:hypothetical protein